jgi:hypothetical protein
MTDTEKALYEKIYNKRPNCKECFCNDLCMFLLLRTGVATTCKDFQKRVREIVDKEINKIGGKT